MNYEGRAETLHASLEEAQRNYAATEEGEWRPAALAASDVMIEMGGACRFPY